MVTLAAFVFLLIVGIAVVISIGSFIASGPGTFTWREARELTRKRHAEERERAHKEALAAAGAAMNAGQQPISDTKPVPLDENYQADGPGI